MSFALDTFSFIIGFVTATVFWWLLGRMRPLWEEVRESWQASRDEAKVRRSVGVEDNHRRATLRRAQGMHLAAPLFSLDEIIEIPRLLAPPATVDPEHLIAIEDIVTGALPYMPSWPEMAAIYQAPSFSLPQVIESGLNLIITGESGIGKTTALAYLASLSANRDEQLGEHGEHVPFLYHVGDLRLPDGEIKDVLTPIQDAVTERASMLDRARLPNFVQLTFNIGRALLLLDGFDELLPDEQGKVCEYLKALRKAYPKTQIVTTGNPEQLGGLTGIGFASMALLPWKIPQRKAFIEKWGQLWMQTVAAEAWSQTEVEQPEEIDPLLINTWLETDNQTLTPLELTLKVWGGYAGDSLGPGVLDAITTHVRRLAPAGSPLAALETLGMQSTLSAQPLFDMHSAKEWIKNFELPEEELPETEGSEQELELDADSEQEKPKDKPSKKKKGKSKTTEQTEEGSAQVTSVLLTKMVESGLLVNHTDHRMRFLHPVLGGYLAGRALASANAGSALLEQPDWSGKLLAMQYVAAYGDASNLANAMLQKTKMPLHRQLFVTARWLRDAPREAPWRGNIFAQLANLLQTEGIPLTLRAQAVAAFFFSGDLGAGPLFRQFLRANSLETIQLAALGCGALQDSKAIEPLSSIIYSPSVGAQQAGCLALVAIGTGPAMEVVARALLHGEEELRRAAAEALANDPKEGHAMLKEGIGLADILLRRASIFGLARIEEDWAIDILQNIQVEDDQWVVRNSASEVLENKQQVDPRLPRRLTPPSETPWLIEFAGKQGMGISPGSPATEILIAALKSDIEEERLGALAYLKHTPTEGVITNLYHAMYRDDPKLREAVFVALCELATSGIKLPDPQQFGLA